MTDGKNNIARENRLLSEIDSLKQAIHQLSALNELATQIGAAKDLAEINKILIRKAQGMTRAEQGIVTLIDREQSGLETIHRTRINKEDTLALRPDPVILGWMEKNKKPIRLQIPDESMKIKWHPAVRSFLCVPLVVNGVLVGLISLFNKKGNDGFTRDDEKPLFIIAMQSAQVLENQRLKNELFEATKSELDLTRQTLSDAQRRLIHSEKMAALGQLTAGIAHEIKNPLNFINNFAQLNNELLKELEEDPQAKIEEYIDLIKDIRVNESKIVEHGNRADRIVSNMMDHAKDGSKERRGVEVNLLVEEYLILAVKSMESREPNFKVDIKREYGERLEKVKMVPQEIGQVLINLFINSFDAMNNHEARQAQLSVTTQKSEQSIEIRITDNGPGIPSQLKDKIFEPFFTTKPAGSGAGLGLSLSHDIIANRHNGSLVVESEEGKGAKFVITLPENM